MRLTCAPVLLKQVSERTLSDNSTIANLEQYTHKHFLVEPSPNGDALDVAKNLWSANAKYQFATLFSLIISLISHFCSHKRLFIWLVNMPWRQWLMVLEPNFPSISLSFRNKVRRGVVGHGEVVCFIATAAEEQQRPSISMVDILCFVVFWRVVRAGAKIGWRQGYWHK